MTLYERKQVDFEHADDRGKLSQLVHEGYQQINVLESKKSVFRGGHYHKVSSEAFFVVGGSVEVTLRKGTDYEKETFHQSDFFELHPYIVHSMYFPEDCVLVALYNVPVEKADGTKDIFAEEV